MVSIEHMKIKRQCSCSHSIELRTYQKHFCTHITISIIRRRTAVAAFVSSGKLYHTIWLQFVCVRHYGSTEALSYE